MTTLCFLLLASHAIGFCADAGKSFRGAFDDVTSDDFAAGPSAVNRNIGGSRNIFFRNVWKNSKFITDTSMSIAESRVEIPLSMSMMMEPPDFDYFMSMSTSTSMYTSTSMSMSTSMSSSMSMSMSMSLSMSMVLENPNGSVIDGPETKATTKSPSATPSTTSTVTPSTTAPMASPSTAPTAKPSTAPTVDGSTAEIVLTYRAVVSDNITSAILNNPDSIYQVELLESISMWATETVSDFKRMESKKNPMFTLRRLRQQTPTDAKARGLPIYHRRLIEVDETSSMKVIDVGEYERP
jgi:cell division septation protein DedD